MTAAESPPPRQPETPQTPETGERYNLAARVYGDGHDGATDPQAADNGDGRAPEPYNLAARVYGDGRAPGPDGSGEAAPGAAVAAPVPAAAVSPPLPPGPPVAVAADRAAEGPPRDGRPSLRTFDSLRVPGFRWYFVAQFGTFGAMNMQMLVSGYLVFTLTGSFAALGTVALARAVPGIGLSMVGGVLADRFPRKYLVQIGQLMSAGIAIGVGLLLLFDMLRFEHLLVSSFLQGGTMSLMMPARQSMLPALVGMGRLQNAAALGMGVMNIMRMVGPALGGFMLGAVGAEYVYFLMTALYLYSVVMYVKVPTSDIREQTGEAGPAARPQMGARGTGRGGPGGGVGLRDIVDGFRYVVRARTIGMLLAVNLVIVLVSMPYQMMLPGFVIDVLKGGPETLGLLQAVAGIGSLSAIVVIASMPNRHRGKVLLVGGLIMGIALIGFSLSTAVLITAPIMVVISIGQTFRMSLSSVLLQTYVDDAYRGRVMSLFMMEMHAVSFATFITGVIASIAGPQLALGGMAVILVVLSLGLWAFVPRLRNLD